MDQTAQVQLYNELLNAYVYFFNQNHPEVRLNKLFFFLTFVSCIQIDITVLNSLIEKLQGEMSKLDSTSTTNTSSNDSDEFIRSQIQKTFDYLRQQSQLEKFKGLHINNQKRKKTKLLHAFSFIDYCNQQQIFVFIYFQSSSLS